MASGAIIGANTTTPDTTRVLSVFVNNLDVTGDVLWSSFSVTDSGTNAKGTANFRIERTPSAVAEITDQAQVRVYDHSASGGEVFRGYIRARRPSEDPAYSYLDIIADDLTSLLDDTVIDVEYRSPESMQARLGYLWGKYAGQHLSGDFSYVLSVGSTLPAQRFETVSLRNAIEMVIAQASSTADYYVDMLGKLHVFTSETNNAPKNINADAPGGGEIAPEELDLEYDSNSYANRVYVKGASPTASGYYQDDAAIAAANGLVRTAIVQAPDCTTATMAQSLANMYLGRVKVAKPRGSFSTTSAKADGWRAGQNVAVTSAAHGLSGTSYRIARVTTKVIRPGANLQRRYDVEFGGAKAGSGIDGVAPLIAGSTAGIYMLDQLGNAIVSTAASAQIGGIGPVMRRYMTSGVYNGDFYAPPPGPDAPVSDATNPLPYWSFAVVSGTSTTAMSVLDSATASGRSVVFSMVAGSAGDEAYIEQIVPVNGSVTRSYSYIPAVVLTQVTNNAMVAFINGQYLKNDGVTTTGASKEFAPLFSALAGTTDIDMVEDSGTAWSAAEVPADAYFLRVRVGIRRGAEAAGSSGQVKVGEIRLVAGGPKLVVAEGGVPASYSPFTIIQNGGSTTIANNWPALSGVTSGIYLTRTGASTGPMIDMYLAGGAVLTEQKLKFSPQGAIATRTTTQSITTSTWSAVDFTGTDISDPFAFHDPASNSTRIIVPTGWGGTYLAVGNANFGVFTATCLIGWSVNGAGAGVPDSNRRTEVTNTAVGAAPMNIIVPIELNAGDYVELMVFHNQGGNQNLATGATGALYYIGELV